jgi:hypothetical protein
MNSLHCTAGYSRTSGRLRHPDHFPHILVMGVKYENRIDLKTGRLLGDLPQPPRGALLEVGGTSTVSSQ